MMHVDPIIGARAHENWLPPPPGRRPFCLDPHGQPTGEDICPKWLVRVMKRHGIRNTDPQGRRIGWPTTPICQHCDNTWTSALENDVKDISTPMFPSGEIARPPRSRSTRSGSRQDGRFIDAVGGNIVLHEAGQGLEICRQPHHGMRVWIAAYHDPNLWL
ncbi:hypothetical protein ACF08O_07910 [Streptomyces paradoxus]|uniref:hypothetical protein n=1 Tax=Streptomyces paradoxus TaxID=66375 RepID=UPI0036F61754